MEQAAIVLRTTVGSWSAGTRVEIADGYEQNPDIVGVRPWCSDEILYVAVADLVQRRSRSPKPQTEPA